MARSAENKNRRPLAAAARRKSQGRGCPRLAPAPLAAVPASPGPHRRGRSSSSGSIWPNPARAWKIFTHTYLVTDASTLHYDWGYIALHTAPTIAGPWASQPLLGWAGSSPLSTSGVQQILTDIPQLSDCLIFTEPGAAALSQGPGGLLLALGCVSVAGGGAAEIRVVLLSSTNHGAQWAYKGEAVRGSDAALLGFAIPQLNAADLFYAPMRGGHGGQLATQLLLSVTPAALLWEGFVGYAGCLVLQLLPNASGVVRDGNSGAPVVSRYLVPAGGATFAGACTSAHVDNGGVAPELGGYLLPVLAPGEPQPFRVLQSGIPPGAPACGKTAVASPHPPFSLPAPDYLGFVNLTLPLLDAAHSPAACTKLAAAGALCDPATDLAQAHAAMYLATHAPSSISRVSALLLEYLKGWRNVTKNGTGKNPSVDDFFACRPLATSAGILFAASAGGVPAGWAPADVADLTTAASQVCFPCCQQGVFNQPMSRAAGIAIFLHYFPQADAEGALSSYARDTWAQWAGPTADGADHTYMENSNVYNSIFLAELFALGGALNMSWLAEDLATPATRRMLLHFRDTIGPSGLAPAYGDDWSLVGGSGAGTGGNRDTAVWPAEEGCYWPSVFERAAAAYTNESSRFSWAAASYFHSVSGGYQLSPPLGPPQIASKGDRPGKCLLHFLEAAALRPPAAPAPQWMGDEGPAATMRNVPAAEGGGGAPAPDKLLLYTSRAPCTGAAMAPYAAFETFSA